MCLSECVCVCQCKCMCLSLFMHVPVFENMPVYVHTCTCLRVYVPARENACTCLRVYVPARENACACLREYSACLRASGNKTSPRLIPAADLIKVPLNTTAYRNPGTYLKSVRAVPRQRIQSCLLHSSFPLFLSLLFSISLGHFWVHFFPSFLLFLFLFLFWLFCIFFFFFLLPVFLFGCLSVRLLLFLPFFMPVDVCHFFLSHFSFSSSSLTVITPDPKHNHYHHQWMFSLLLSY